MPNDPTQTTGAARIAASLMAAERHALGYAGPAAGYGQNQTDAGWVDAMPVMWRLEPDLVRMRQEPDGACVWDLTVLGLAVRALLAPEQAR